MNYKETTEYLFSQLPFYQQVGSIAYKPGLNNALALAEIFDHPHKSFKTIHVGGTNGKGSISHTLAAILQESGYKVGLYTSPHLIDFRERIRINGQKIEEQYVIEFVKKNRLTFEPIGCSFFELTMMMSFCYFKENEVDIAIIEVGLGGRLDSTNIITPDLCIISNIGIDHTQFLGTTTVEIAREKAGIIKSNVPIIIGEAENEIKEVFLSKALEMSAPISFADFESPIIDSKIEDGKWVFTTSKLQKIQGELGGFAQIKNANTIITAVGRLYSLGYAIPQDAIYKGFSGVCKLTGLMGRWQIISQSPKIICDTAHNISGIKYVVDQLINEKYKKLHIIIGMANDKDINDVLEILPKDAIYYFVNANIARALPSAKLRVMANDYFLDGIDYSSISEGFYSAKKNCAPDDLIFVGGSNFVVGEFLSLIQNELKEHSLF